MIIILIVIILIYLIFLYINNLIKKEHFTNISSETNELNYQTGNGPADTTGTITFPTPFSQIPMVFTQIIGSSSNAKVVYSIQVYNITTTSFDYIKNKVYSYVLNNENVQNANIISIDNSTTESFIWLALIQ